MKYSLNSNNSDIMSNLIEITLITSVFKFYYLHIHNSKFCLLPLFVLEHDMKFYLPKSALFSHCSFCQLM